MSTSVWFRRAALCVQVRRRRRESSGNSRAGVSAGVNDVQDRLKLLTNMSVMDNSTWKTVVETCLLPARRSLRHFPVKEAAQVESDF